MPYSKFSVYHEIRLLKKTEIYFSSLPISLTHFICKILGKFEMSRFERIKINMRNRRRHRWCSTKICSAKTPVLKSQLY